MTDSDTQPRSWYQLSITSSSEHAAFLADLLQALDALSVSLIDAKDQPLFQLQPEDQPLWQETQVLALFHTEHEAKQALDIVCSQSSSTINSEISLIVDQDWVRENQKNFPAKAFGSSNTPLWVIPSWEPTEQQATPYIRIDPGLAFGTGTHPTTALCLNWLADHPPRDLQVIDYGCGSGILSLACLALGAQHVTAVDHDMQALEASQNNCALNRNIEKNCLGVFLPEACPKQPAGLVIANILANPLIELADTLVSLVAPKGQLLLSGILSEEVERVVSHYKGFHIVETQHHDGWACCLISR